MPRLVVESSERMSLRIATEDKSLLMRAAVIQHVNLTEFVLRNAVQIAHQVIEQNERIELSKRDSKRVLELLDNPPKPNEKLLAASRALSKKK